MGRKDSRSERRYQHRTHMHSMYYCLSQIWRWGCMSKTPTEEIYIPGNCSKAYQFRSCNRCHKTPIPELPVYRTAGLQDLKKAWSSDRGCDVNEGCIEALGPAVVFVSFSLHHTSSLLVLILRSCSSLSCNSFLFPWRASGGDSCPCCCSWCCPWWWCRCWFCCCCCCCCCA